MTPEQEIKVVELCKQFMLLAEEINLTFYDLCNVRDKYFSVVNGRRLQNPVDLANSVKVLEDHCTEMRSVLGSVMGVADAVPKAEDKPKKEPKKIDVKPEAKKPDVKPVEPKKEDPVVTPAPAPEAAPSPSLAVSPKLEAIALKLSMYVRESSIGPRSKGKINLIITQSKKDNKLSDKDREYLKGTLKGKLMNEFLETIGS